MINIGHISVETEMTVDYNWILMESCWRRVSQKTGAAQYQEAIGLVKFVRSCIADRIMSSVGDVKNGMVEVEQEQLLMWRKLLNQSLTTIESFDAASNDESASGAWSSDQQTLCTDSLVHTVVISKRSGRNPITE